MKVRHRSDLDLHLPSEKEIIKLWLPSFVLAGR